jgi:hypothetical protein
MLYIVCRQDNLFSVSLENYFEVDKNKVVLIRCLESRDSSFPQREVWIASVDIGKE